jgi:hypothetical protein
MWDIKRKLIFPQIKIIASVFGLINRNGEGRGVRI